jgi:hypothetical protein
VAKKISTIPPRDPSDGEPFTGAPSDDTFRALLGNEVIFDGPHGRHTVLTGFETCVFADGRANSSDGDPRGRRAC